MRLAPAIAVVTFLAAATAGIDALVANDGVADVLIDCGDGTDRLAVHDAGLDPSPVSCP